VVDTAAAMRPSMKRRVMVILVSCIFVQLS
jgi:hypothetical protein